MTTSRPAARKPRHREGASAPVAIQPEPQAWIASRLAGARHDRTCTRALSRPRKLPVPAKRLPARG
jgi:hypothetical protein